MHSIHSGTCAGFYLPVQVHPIGKWQHLEAIKLNGTQTQLNFPGYGSVS